MVKNSLELGNLPSPNKDLSSDEVSNRNRTRLQFTVTGPLKQRIKFSRTEALKLNNFEVFVSFLKFLI